MSTILSVPAFAFLFASVAAGPLQAASFTFQTISNPQYPSTRAFGINDNGVISGDHGGSPIVTYTNGTFTE
jgi:hypothetical protein